MPRSYVDTQLRKSKRFDAEGMQRDHPELFRPLPRRYSRSSSSANLSTSVLDPAAKRMAPLSHLNEALKRSASPEFLKKPGNSTDDEGQLRYWTNDMCTEKPHLFDFVVTVSAVAPRAWRARLTHLRSSAATARSCTPRGSSSTLSRP